MRSIYVSVSTELAVEVCSIYASPVYKTHCGGVNYLCQCVNRTRHGGAQYLC